MQTREIIFAMIRDIAARQKKSLVPLDDDLELLESGLDSLCIAILVARLEDELGLDPLSSISDDEFPVTIGDFIKLYESSRV